jgi:cell shape-determining protein MreC
MTYLSGKAHKQKQGYMYLLYVALLGVLVVFWVSFKGHMFPVFEPVVIYYAEAKSSVKSIPEFFATYTTSRSTLIQKTKTLEVTIENLENEIAEKDAQIKEFSDVSSVLGSTSLGSVLVMYPLMNDITRIYSTILLSKGYKDGVEKDSYVYVRGLQPVCIIKEVYTSTSLCELLSSSGIITDAVVVGDASSTMISVSLTGRGGGTFLGDVARDTPISVGEKVVLRSDQSMTIGTVVDVLHNNQDTSWHVFVRGSYNPITSSIFYFHKK